jgi:ATP-dependent DNA helicase DinG
VKPGGSPAVSWRADPLALLDTVVGGIGGERRAGQRELTAAVADAIARGHHLVAEAPTGSGKSLAYLVPAVASGLKVVVATSTIALQRQLVGKDLPALLEHGSIKFSFALLKGRSNYLCRAKLRASESPDALFELPVGPDFGRLQARLRKFAERSDTGDRAELEHEINPTAWAAVSCTSIECPGKSECADGAECFAERARDRAREVSVLVVNHALYCSHLASEGRVLPDHDIVIIDEAHSFPDNATSAFAADIATDGITRMSGMLARAGADKTAVDALNEAGRRLAAVIDARDGTVDVVGDEEVAGALVAAGERLATASAKLDRAGNDDAKRTTGLALGRLEVLRRLAAPGPDDVVWVERVGRTRRMRIAPIAAGETIGSSLLARHPVIAVSATLGGEPPFPALARQMGFYSDAEPGAWADPDDLDPDVVDHDADRAGRPVARAGRGYVAVRTSSSFDWRAQGILYVAKDLPDPTRARDAWVEAAGDRICALVNASGGRALVLCTSRANVTHFAAMLRERTDHDVLEQGERDAGRLAESFIEDESSVLVGTRSFWAGIDAAGAACVLVVIDRIPFPAPGEPVQDARRTRAQQSGLSPFNAIDLPVAALVLAQGTGRLIRTATDRGVVAVLDPRLATRPYRVQLLAAMPPLRRSIDLADACALLEELAAASPTRRRPADIAAVSPVDDPRQLRTDLSSSESVGIRNLVACPVCAAEIGTRCHDRSGTSAFLHDGRVRAVTQPLAAPDISD